MRGFAKFFVGLVVAAFILGSGGYFLFNYAVAKLTTPPPKPIFPNDSASYKKQSKRAKTPAGRDQAVADSAASASPSATPSASPVPSPSLPPGAFMGRVTQPIGLILREKPEGPATQMGGLEYNEIVAVLETSSDNAWQKVRLLKGEKEGWVKGGNIEKAQ
jgi:cytoskeletal protein RodZ